MSWPCSGCGSPRPHLLAALFHCDPAEPIDDIADTDVP